MDVSQRLAEDYAMEIGAALVMFGVGLGLIIFFAEQLVKGVVGTSMGFGLSAFLLSVIFIGFDPDNLAVGTVASAEMRQVLTTVAVTVNWAESLAARAAPAAITAASARERRMAVRFMGNPR